MTRIISFLFITNETVSVSGFGLDYQQKNRQITLTDARKNTNKEEESEWLTRPIGEVKKLRR